MQVVAGGKYNLISWTLNTTAKTLTFSNIVNFDLEGAMVLSIYDSTTASNFSVGKNITSCVLTYSAGLPVWTVTFNTLPAGAANTDVLVILLNIPDATAVYTLLSYSASKV